MISLENQELAVQNENLSDEFWRVHMPPLPEGLSQNELEDEIDRRIATSMRITCSTSQGRLATLGLFVLVFSYFLIHKYENDISENFGRNCTNLLKIADLCFLLSGILDWHIHVHLQIHQSFANTLNFRNSKKIRNALFTIGSFLVYLALNGNPTSSISNQ